MTQLPQRIRVKTFGASLGDAMRRHHVARKLPLQFDPDAIASELAQIDASDWITYSGPYYDEGRYLSVGVTPNGHLGGMLSSFPGEIRMARLTRLLPGGRISRHRDRNVPRDSVRIHIPVITGNQVEFWIGGVKLPMHAGQAWQIDPRFPHEVYNGGETDRVHMIVDLRHGPALDELLDRGESVRKAFLTAYFLREAILWPRGMAGAVWHRVRRTR